MITISLIPDDSSCDRITGTGSNYLAAVRNFCEVLEREADWGENCPVRESFVLAEVFGTLAEALAMPKLETGKASAHYSDFEPDNCFTIEIAEQAEIEAEADRMANELNEDEGNTAKD